MSFCICIWMDLFCLCGLFTINIFFLDLDRYLLLCSSLFWLVLSSRVTPLRRFCLFFFFYLNLAALVLIDIELSTALPLPFLFIWYADLDCAEFRCLSWKRDGSVLATRWFLISAIAAFRRRFGLAIDDAAFDSARIVYNLGWLSLESCSVSFWFLSHGATLDSWTIWYFWRCSWVDACAPAGFPSLAPSCSHFSTTLASL